MSIRPSARRKTLYLLGSFLGLVVAPLWLWAVRAPDAAYAPLPDYDIRWGYAAGTTFNHPGIAEEAALLRQQRSAKGLAGGAGRSALRAGDAAGVTAAFGPEAKVEWSPTGTPRTLRRATGTLTAPQPGSDSQGVAREFLRSHPALFGLSDSAVEALTVARQINSPRARHITFRQTVDGVPIYGADYKVSLTADNAVLSAGGRLFPDLRVAAEAKFSAVEATQAAASYVGSLWSKPRSESGTRPSPPALSGPAADWVTSRGEDSGEFTPAVLSSEAGPEQKTTLAAEPFRREVLASRVVFPLTATQGRPAWRVYLLKAPMEYYELIVDAEDGALLARTNQVKFIVTPQGLVFVTHPDAGPQVTRSFVGDATASPNTFVDPTQSTHQGNNAFPLLGGNDGTGANNFSFSFTNSYLNVGAQSFNLDINKTIQFSPNGAGGYDMTFPTPFVDASAGTNLLLTDDSYACGAAPAGFTYFGSSVSTVCAGSNGFVTITFGSFFFEENVADMLNGNRRIMGLWDDLNPSAGGNVGVSFTGSSSSPSSLCFRWNGVPEFGVANTNSFSICLYGTSNPNGLPVSTIRLLYPTGGVSAADGLVGITPQRSLFTSTTGDSKNTTVFTTFTTATSTIGPIGFARQFPSHNDVAAGATNIFWHMNENGHDRLYAQGFTETAGNMQNDNFGRGGLQNDPIEIWYAGTTGVPSDLGGPTNNAYFATTSDGSCCSFTNFLLFTNPPFRRVDSAFDGDVILHEHGHGVSTRFIGGLDSPQGGAMGEGWSDWFALSYSGDPVMGEYVTGNNSTGIRGVRYDASSTRQWGHFANIFGPTTLEAIGVACCGTTKGTIFLPEVHDDGEIWASMLADVRAAMMGGGWTTLEVETYILDSLAATPPDPSMLEARDALLASPTGPDECYYLWPVFAARGFGDSADYHNVPLGGAFPDFSLSPFQSVDQPGACGGSFSDVATPIHTANFDSAVLNSRSGDGWKGQRKTLWHVSNRRASTGAQSFYFGQESTGTYEKVKLSGAVKRSKGTLTSPKLNLSAATRPVLEMDLFIVVEEFFPWDSLWVRISTDGGTTYPIQRAIMPWNTNGVFERVRIDLSPAAGKSNVKIQLYFDTADNVTNAFEGVYVDNVVIRNYVEN